MITSLLDSQRKTLALLPIFSLVIGLFSLSSTSYGMPYLDKDFECFSKEKASQYVRDYSVDVESFGGLELCNSNVDTKKLLNDFSIIENGSFSESGQNNLIQNFVPAKNYYSWMKAQTRGVRRGNDIPTATAYNSFGYFTMQDGWAASSTLGRVGTVIHEARHTAGYRHYPCNGGPYGGVNTQACDSSYSAAGSHAVEMEYYARVVVQGQNFHPVYQSMARLMAMARANFVFNQPVLKAKETLLIQTQNNELKILSEDGSWVNRNATPAFGELKRTSFGAVYFDGTQAAALDLYKNASDLTPLSDVYSYFKLILRDKAPVKLFEEFDANGKRYVVRVNNRNQIQSFKFSQGDWGNAISSDMNLQKVSTRLNTGEAGLFFIGENNQLYGFDPANDRLQRRKESWNSEDKSIVSLGDRLLILKQNGQVTERLKSGWQNWEQSGPIQQILAVPLYDSFEVTR